MIFVPFYEMSRKIKSEENLNHKHVQRKKAKSSFYRFYFNFLTTVEHSFPLSDTHILFTAIRAEITEKFPLLLLPLSNCNFGRYSNNLQLPQRYQWGGIEWFSFKEFCHRIHHYQSKQFWTGLCESCSTGLTLPCNSLHPSRCLKCVSNVGYVAPQFKNTAQLDNDSCCAVSPECFTCAGDLPYELWRRKPAQMRTKAANFWQTNRASHLYESYSQIFVLSLCRCHSEWTSRFFVPSPLFDQSLFFVTQMSWRLEKTRFVQ